VEFGSPILPPAAAPLSVQAGRGWFAIRDVSPHSRSARRAGPMIAAVDDVARQIGRLKRKLIVESVI
jgi:hypothetical protein